MGSREQILAAIEAQEKLRGSVPDEVIDAAVEALQAQLEPVEQSDRGDRRGQATVLFADVAGFTALSERLDPEVIAGLMNELWSVLDSAIERHGGRVDKHMGDAVMGVWGMDDSREDNPERAIRAALEMTQGFQDFRRTKDLGIEIRVGVNTGPVLFGTVGTGTESSVTGDTVNVASRLEQAAPLGGVLISLNTYRHIRGVFDVQPLEPIRAKGKSEAVRCLLVSQEKPRSFREPTRGIEGVETQLVGRDAELGQLITAYERCVDTSSARQVTVLGEAGAGKSRLLEEFTEWLDLQSEGIYYLKGRCLPDLVGVPRSLIRELFNFRFEIFDDDAQDRVGAKLRAGFGVLDDAEADVVGHWMGFDLSHMPAVVRLAGSPEFGTVALAHLTRYFRALLSESPAVVVLEDVHWADNESLAVFEELIDRLGQAPLLVIRLARPTFLMSQEDQAGESTTRSLIRLAALSDDDVRSLTRDILHRLDQIPEALVELIRERAEGNPFYVEELIKMLIDDGVIRAPGDGTAWSVESPRLDGLLVPPTIEGVLEARLNALTPTQRRTLQHASVIGRSFWDAAVAALREEEAGPEADGVVSADLNGLQGRELIRHNPHSSIANCSEFLFKHALLRDATYETVLLRDRRRLHSLAARWLEAQSGPRVDEHLGLIAEHLEKADAIDRAAELHERAGARFQAMGSLDAARLAYQRALSLRARLGSDHDFEAATARLALGRVLELSGELDTADHEFQVAEEDAGDHDVGVVALAQIGRARVACTEGDWAAATEFIARAEPSAQQIGGEVQARLLAAKAWMLARTGHVGDAVTVAEDAQRVSRQVEDPALELDVLITLAGAHAFAGNTGTASGMYRQGLELARRVGNLERQAILMGNVAALEHAAAENRSDTRLRDAIGLYRETLSLQEELGTSGAIMTLGNLAQALVEAGNVDEASACAARALHASSTRRLSAERAIALLVHAEIAIARGHIERGLEILGAVAADPRTHDITAHGELQRVLGLFHITADTATAGMQRGGELDLDALTEEVLDSVSN